MQLRSPLAAARGLGSAKDGAGHWWSQRVSAVALIPLTFWFVVSLASHAGAGYAETMTWLSSPVTVVLLSLYLVVAFYHSQLGLQVVVEDYVHHTGLKFVTLILLQFINVVLPVAAIFSVLWISLGGA